VAKKILYVNEVLGGLSRLTFQMGVSTLPHEKMLRAIEILGTRGEHDRRNDLRTKLSVQTAIRVWYEVSGQRTGQTTCSRCRRASGKHDSLLGRQPYSSSTLVSY